MATRLTRLTRLARHRGLIVEVTDSARFDALPMDLFVISVPDDG